MPWQVPETGILTAANAVADTGKKMMMGLGEKDGGNRRPNTLCPKTGKHSSENHVYRTGKTRTDGRKELP